MCRSVVEGGRRCPCSGGATRRAYQRALYARHQAAAVAVAPAPPAPVAATVTAADADPSVAAPVWRDPEPSRREAEEALAELRANTQALHPEIVARYHAAVLAHGATLRDNALAAAQDAWAEDGVADHQIAELLAGEPAGELAEAIARYRAQIDDPATSTADRSLAQLFHDALTERTPLSAQARTALEQANSRRLELLTASVRATLAAERELGGQPRLSDQAKLRKADRETFAAAVAHFPTDLIEAANQRPNLLLPKATTKRAHYRSGARARRMVTYTGVIPCANPDDIDWKFGQVDLVDQQRAGDDRRLRHTTAADTPENRAKLMEALDRYRALHGGLDARRDRAELMEVVVTHPDGTTEKRIYLGIAKYGRMMAAIGDPVSELTFSDHRSAVHELGHHMEADNAEIARACKSFLYRRTAGLDDEVYLSATRTRREERVTADSFVDRYMGKDYPRDHTEIFSTGCEALFAGSYGGLLAVEIEESPAGIASGRRRHRADPEHFALVMGLLATANKTVS